MLVVNVMGGRLGTCDSVKESRVLLVKTRVRVQAVGTSFGCGEFGCEEVAGKRQVLSEGLWWLKVVVHPGDQCA
jgi:hypothetical protein